jgi:hypothetical protein
MISHILVNYNGCKVWRRNVIFNVYYGIKTLHYNMINNVFTYINISLSFNDVHLDMGLENKDNIQRLKN